MSEENVEIVRRLYASWEAQPSRTPIPRSTTCLILRSNGTPRRTFDPGVFHGYDGIREFAARLREVWESGRIEPLEFIPTGEEVVVPVRLAFVSENGPPSPYRNAAHVWTLRDGRATRYRVFQTKAEALEAAGRSE